MTSNTPTHDYRDSERKWGHDITVQPGDGGFRITGSLWSSEPVSVGDYLLLSNGRGETRYQFTEVRRVTDPSDMLHYAAEFAPRGN